MPDEVMDRITTTVTYMVRGLYFHETGTALPKEPSVWAQCCFAARFRRHHAADGKR
jgi:hypothetical protein